LPEPLKASIGTLWRLGRSLLAIVEELEKRPRGRFDHRAIGMLPVVGMAGDYLGERSGLKRVAKRGATVVRETGRTYRQNMTTYCPTRAA
jgi:hypothetical protein